ncbi:MAG: hypothetical protein STSR0009_05220 [Methanoregula sp.]
MKARIAKTFIETIPDWSPEELVFNAIALNEGYRFFGCSHDLSNAMRRQKKDNCTYTWLSTSLHQDDCDDEEDKIIRKNLTWIINNCNNLGVWPH